MDSTVITSRVKEDVRRKLDDECQSKNITLNTLISQILSRHANWGRFAEEVGFVYTTKVATKAFLDSIPVKRIQEISHKECKSALINAVDFIQGEFNFENFIKTLDLWIESSNIEFRHITTDNGEKYIIQHDLGKHWSIYLISLVEAVSWDLNYGVSRKVINEQNISFIIKKVK